MLNGYSIICTGVGIYVSLSQRYAGRQAAQPDNTYMSVYSQIYTSYNTRFTVYCCFNHSYYSSYIGSFTDPNGYTYTSNFRDLRIERYAISSSYAGCIQLRGYESSYYSSLSYTSGVYTCNAPDSNGQTRSVNFALYGYNSECKSLILFRLVINFVCILF